MDPQREKSRFKGQTSLTGILVMLFVLADVLIYPLMIIARIICGVLAVCAIVAAYRHWDALSQSTSKRQFPGTVKILRILCRVLLIVIPIWFLLIPAVPVIIQAIMAGICTIVQLRLCLLNIQCQNHLQYPNGKQ